MCCAVDNRSKAPCRLEQRVAPVGATLYVDNENKSIHSVLQSSPLPPFTNLKWNWLEVEGSYFNKKNIKVIEKKLQILSQYCLDNYDFLKKYH